MYHMYRIAIPSYNRAEQLGKKTLNTLESHGIDKSIIDIFVANKEQYELYKNMYPDYNIIIGEMGIREIREFIFLKHYNEGDKIISFDDDIELINKKHPTIENRFANCELNLKEEFKLAFDACERSGMHMWGVYPVNNSFFMRNSITYDYKFIIGHLFGVIVKKEQLSHTPGIGARDDYERTIKHYLADGGVVRLNYLCCKTKYISEGGIGIDRDAEITLKLLIDTYPGLVSIRTKGNNPNNPILMDKREL